MITAGIEVNSLEAARQTVAELTETAQRCAQPAGPTPRRPRRATPSVYAQPPTPARQRNGRPSATHRVERHPAAPPRFGLRPASTGPPPASSQRRPVGPDC